MKKFKSDYNVLIGILSIIVAVALCGIPVGKEAILTGYFVVFLLINFGFIVLGLLLKKDKAFMVYTAVGLVVLVIGTIIIEMTVKDSKTVVLGWLVGFILSVIGLYKTFGLKKGERNRFAILFNIVGLVLAIANLIIGLVVNGGFIIK